MNSSGLPITTSVFIQTLTEFHLLWVFGKRYELTCRSPFLSTGHQCQLANGRMFYGTQGRNGKRNFKPCVVVTTVVTGRRPARVWFRVAQDETLLQGALLALFPHTGNRFYIPEQRQGREVRRTRLAFGSEFKSPTSQFPQNIFQGNHTENPRRFIHKTRPFGISPWPYF